jgi:hypothetical protein
MDKQQTGRTDRQTSRLLHRCIVAQTIDGKDRQTGTNMGGETNGWMHRQQFQIQTDMQVYKYIDRQTTDVKDRYTV